MHPVANHPILSSAFPDFAENLLASTIGTLAAPAEKLQAFCDTAKAYTVERLVKNGVDAAQADDLGDVARKAVEENHERLKEIAARFGLTSQMLCLILVNAQDATFRSLENALSTIDPKH